MEMPWVAKQPIDKVCVDSYQLFCLPNELKLVKPEMNDYQAPIYREENSLVIKQPSFVEILHFFFQCCQLLDPNRDLSQSPKSYEHKCSSLSINCLLKVNPEITELQLSCDDVTFNFSKNIIPLLMGAFSKLVFKSYCYSHNVNYLINQYVTLAPSNLIKQPTLDGCLEIYHQLNHPYIDFYLFYDIIERHKKLLYNLKSISIFKEVQ